jgi:hypothetical protein
MRDVIYLLFHWLTTLTELIKPGGARAVIAENLLLKQQLIPMSHPIVERLIGSVRRELLDQTFFWTVTDMENKLRAYQDYYNKHRCHAGRYGATPVDSGRKNILVLNDYRWKKHCRGLFQLPEAA